jgi:hypothetical protein
MSLYEPESTRLSTGEVGRPIPPPFDSLTAFNENIGHVN